MVMGQSIRKIVVVLFRQTLVSLSGAEVITQQLSGLSELSGLASSESSELSGRTMEHATGQDAALGGRSSFLVGLHVCSSLQAPQGRPEEGGYPNERAVPPLTLDANDEALIAEIAEMTCGG